MGWARSTRRGGAIDSAERGQRGRDRGVQGVQAGVEIDHVAIGTHEVFELVLDALQASRGHVIEAGRERLELSAEVREQGVSPESGDLIVQVVEAISEAAGGRGLSLVQALELVDSGREGAARPAGLEGGDAGFEPKRGPEQRHPRARRGAIGLHLEPSGVAVEEGIRQRANRAEDQPEDPARVQHHGALALLPQGLSAGRCGVQAKVEADPVRLREGRWELPMEREDGHRVRGRARRAAPRRLRPEPGRCRR